jgi:hypothetical protein
MDRGPQVVQPRGGKAITTPTTTPTCVNHPKVETRLTCSSCGDPICTRCMVTTAVGQKCPRCAKQSGRAKGNPEPQLLARAFGAGLAVAAAGGFLLVAVPFAGLLLALAHGFVVGAAVRWAARRRTHAWLGLVAAVAVLVGLGGLVLVLGGNPFAARLLLAYVLSAGVAFARASGAW